LVGFDAFGLDIPAGVARRTGVELGFNQLVQPLALHFGLTADALQPAAFLFGIDAHIIGRAGAVGQIVGDFVAADGRAVLREFEFIACGNGVGGLVVIGPLRVQYFIVALDNDVALGADGHFGFTLDLVGGYARIVGGKWVFAAPSDGISGQAQRARFGLDGFMRTKQTGRAQRQIPGRFR
jgi:hypothetical protein